MSQNVVKLFGSVMDTASLAIVTEYCDKGDMSSWMDSEIKNSDKGVHLATVLEAYVQLGTSVEPISAELI